MAGIIRDPTVAVSATTEPFMPGEEHAHEHIRLRHASAHPADDPLTELDEPIGDRRAGHELAGQHEERNRGQRHEIDGAEHLPRNEDEGRRVRDQDVYGGQKDQREADRGARRTRTTRKVSRRMLSIAA